MAAKQPKKRDERERSLLGKLHRSVPSMPALSWGDIDPDLVFRTIVAVTNAGSGLTFTRTRKGDCLVVTVLEGQERQTTYPNDVHVAEDFLRELEEAALGVLNDDGDNASKS